MTHSPTPQEKAKELVEKFNMTLPNTHFPFSKNEFAKQCAAICVQEIIDENNLLFKDGNKDAYKSFGKRVQYWQQVLTEIQSL